MAAFAFAVAMLGTTLPTPLYPLYQRHFGFSELTITVIFATYAAGTAIPSSAINPLSAQIISYFKQFSAALPVSGLSTGSNPTGLASGDYAVQVPFTDNADKGDLRGMSGIDEPAFLMVQIRPVGAVPPRPEPRTALLEHTPVIR